MKPARKKVSSTVKAVAGWKRWLFRLLIAVGVPAVFFLILELGLRLAGFGYPVNFLLPSSSESRKTFVENNQFGWRFFGRQMAREPYPFSIYQAKPANTIRIFVFGESAAYGDPQPRFGLSRMIQAMLRLRYPGTRFEVVNTGMTGINSHTILPIARDCAAANGDILVLYMGNNEVVGPFGAGTVFGPQAPPLPLVRASLSLKATRTGQLFDSLVQGLRKPPPEKSEWGGMLMFLDHQISADDPRMKAVYHHFKQNAADIIQAGLHSGAGIVLSTVAVNLKDCAPFASAHRPGLPEPDKTKWEQLYKQGVELQNSGNAQAAAEQFRAAAQIDDAFAELRFRQAQCALALGRIPEAQSQFQAACERDTLRFRCDNQLNDLTRAAAQAAGSKSVLLADSEKTFAEQSPDGLPGSDLFYDHVHLTFEGNYLLARSISARIEQLLPEQITARTPVSTLWPSVADCAQSLAWTDEDRRAGLSDMLARLSDPPFTGQINHDAQVQRLAALTQKLAAASGPEALRDAIKICETAVAAAPDDPWLYAQLASYKLMTGDLAGAATAAQREVQLLPSSPESWSQLGLILVQQKKFEDAANAFQRAFQVDSQDVWSLQNLAQSYVKLGRREDAAREYHRVLAIKPRFGLAWLGLGQLLEEAGHKTEAEDCYHKALANRIRRAPELATLARFCQSRGWLDAAATNYDDAVKLNPSDASLQVEAGQNLAALGRHSEAMRFYADAAQLAPDLEQAHFLYGLELGQAGKSDEAVAQFREAVRIMPDLLEARLNLGIALVHQGRGAEALTQFQQVLQQSPTNALALKYVEALTPRQ
jgi:tetratricopeptide (TPR) repeat protein